MLLILSGCGGHSKSPGVRVTGPSQPIWCPSKLTLPTGLSKPNRPADRSFDARALLGQPESEAAARARGRGCAWRVVKRDGQNLAVTADVRSDRIDAAILHGKVTAIGVF